MILTIRSSPRNSQNIKLKLTDPPFCLKLSVAFWKVGMGIVLGFGVFFLAFGKFGQMLV